MKEQPRLIRRFLFRYYEESLIFMDIYRIVLILFFVIIFQACDSGISTLREGQIIRVNPEEKLKEFDMCTLLDTNSFAIVPLETKREYLIGEISHIFIKNRKFYIVDKTTKAIYIFTNSGNFISKIQNIGRGASEYTNITDAFLYKDDIYIMDVNMGKLLVYDTLGIFKHEKKINDLWGEAMFIHNDQIFYINDWSKSKSGCYRLYSTNLTGEKLQCALPFSKKESTRGWGIKNFYTINRDHVTFTYSSIDTIYQIFRNDSIRKYYIDLGSKKLPSRLAKLSLPELVEKHIDQEYILGINSMQECGDYLFFEFKEKNEVYYIVYNQVTHKNKVYKSIISSKYIDIHPFVFSEGYLISIYSAMSLLQMYEYLYKDKVFENQYFKKLLDQKVQNIGEMNNPVLFLYKLKDE